MYFNQRNLLYSPSENNYTNDSVEFTFEEVSIPTPTGISIKGWLHKKDLKQKKTLFTNNVGHIDARIFTYFQNRLIDTDCAAGLVEVFLYRLL